MLNEELSTGFYLENQRKCYFGLLIFLSIFLLILCKLRGCLILMETCEKRKEKEKEKRGGKKGKGEKTCRNMETSLKIAGIFVSKT